MERGMKKSEQKSHVGLETNAGQDAKLISIWTFLSHERSGTK